MSDSDTQNSTDNAGQAGNDSAVNLVRQKLESVYGSEPNAKEEVAEIVTSTKPLSKHQAYMQKISTSGMSLAEIQTAWHKYYVELSDTEKHQVWKEFYAEHDRQADRSQTAPKAPSEHSMNLPLTGAPNVHDIPDETATQPKTKKQHLANKGARTISEVKKQFTQKAKASANGRLKAKQHFQSLLFGVGMGCIVVIILLFGFFNDRFIAPFITPSRNVSSTPIIIDGSTTSADATPKIIIPKINVEIPVVYTEPSIEEHAVQSALEGGVVHYATTPDPGQKGNAVIFGHSSNNILNKGKYKFAFVLLNKLEVGDTFYLNKDGVRYGYKIYERKIVEPNEVSVLGSTDKPATVTLITCDPPGTTRHRLVVIGEQISPNPDTNKSSTALAPDAKTTELPSNAPSLWSRLTDWL